VDVQEGIAVLLASLVETEVEATHNSIAQCYAFLATSHKDNYNGHILCSVV